MKKIIILALIFCTFSALSVAQTTASCNRVDCTGECGMFVDNNGDGFCDQGRLSQPDSAGVQQPTTTPAPTEKPEKSKFDTPYHLISITGGLLVLYFISVFFVKKKKMKKITHRKIWNVALLITFLVSGLLGMVLVFFINYGYRPTFYRDIKVIHVEFGIGMSIITIYHIIWHINYFKTIFPKKKRLEKERGREGVGRNLNS